MGFLDKIFKKKVVEQPVEKKPISITEMKVKYNVFSSKVDGSIGKYKSLIDKKIKQATALKLKGMNASMEIKEIARLQSKIVGLERRKSIFERQIDNVEEIEMQREFLAAMKDMTGILSGASLDAEEIASVNDEIINQTLRMTEQQRQIEGKMDELDAALDSFDALGGAQFSEVESSIDALIERTIQDAQLSADGASADQIARSVIHKLKIEE